MQNLVFLFKYIIVIVNKPLSYKAFTLNVYCTHFQINSTVWNLAAQTVGGFISIPLNS